VVNERERASSRHKQRGRDRACAEAKEHADRQQQQGWPGVLERFPEQGQDVVAKDHLETEEREPHRKAPFTDALEQRGQFAMAALQKEIAPHGLIDLIHRRDDRGGSNRDPLTRDVRAAG
jgi:hypothetical protein